MAKDAALENLAALQYLGYEGCTQPCLDAVLLLLGLPEPPLWVKLLTSDSTHAFVFDFEQFGTVVIKNGFSSGYRGEGPHGLANALRLLHSSNASVDEYLVPTDMMRRLESSALTSSDLQTLEESRPVRPHRWIDYVVDVYGVDQAREIPDGLADPILPLSVLSRQLWPLAIVFKSDPDKALMEGYRMIEELVRDQTGLKEHGSALFSAAFLGEPPKLVWTHSSVRRNGVSPCLDKGEMKGRGLLFVAIFQAFRNARAHRRESNGYQHCFQEFMMLNQLFLLLAEAERYQRPEPVISDRRTS